MTGREYKIIRMWCGLSQTAVMRKLGLKSRSFLYTLEDGMENNMPLKCIQVLADVVKYDLLDNEVVNDLIENVIPAKYRNANRINRRSRSIF